jgi:hypothetical protein
LEITVVVDKAEPQTWMIVILEFSNYISNKVAEAKETASDISMVGGVHIGALKLHILDASEAQTAISNSFRLIQHVSRSMEQQA